MIFLSALTSFILSAFDVTVVTCDATWMSRDRLEQMVGAELAELPEEARQGMILTVDHCEETEVRIRVSNRHGQQERDIHIGEIPEEAKMRTVVLALAELAGTPDSVPAATVAEEEAPSPSTKKKQDAESPEAARPKVAPTPRPQPQCASPPPDNRIGFFGGVYLRGFPMAKTIAPEARFGIHTRRYRVALGGYGMGWTSSLGTAYLIAATVTAGPTLFTHQGRVIAMGLDVLAELGGVIAFGKAETNSEHTSKVNIAAGGHLSFWLAMTRLVKIQPMVMLEAGWLRGFNTFAGDTFLGGFEGPSASVGVGVKL